MAAPKEPTIGNANGESSRGQEVDGEAGGPDKTKQRFGSLVKGIWTKAGLDFPTLMLMAKSGLAPAIALAMFQTDAVSQIFPTLGYLFAIVSILGLGFMPRAKFMQNMALSIFSVLFAVAVCMLVAYSAVRARLTTPSSPPMRSTSSAPTAVSAQRPGYNSSASVVCAVWLFFLVYCLSYVRAKYPQFSLPCILFAIFVNVTSAYAPMFPTVDYAITFVQRIMYVFLMGLGVATGVHFVFFPLTTRTIVLKEFAGFLNLSRKTLQLEIGYFQEMSDASKFPISATEEDIDEKTHGSTPQATVVRSSMAALQALFGKLNGDLKFARREIAIGKLGGDDLNHMFASCRKIFLPLVGLSALVDTFERLYELQMLDDVEPTGGWRQDPQEVRRATIKDWMDYMAHLKGPLGELTETIGEGIQHVLLVLGLVKAPKKSATTAMSGSDVEEKADDVRPGSEGFATYMKAKIDAFQHGKEDALRSWAERKGIQLPSDFFDHEATTTYDMFSLSRDEEFHEHQRRQRQLYMLLYIEYLLHTSAVSVHDFVTLADNLRKGGKLSHWRLVYPGRKQLRKWFDSIWLHQDVTENDQFAGNDLGGDSQHIHLGSAYSARRDPEHLPPVTELEKIGNYVRLVPTFLRSSESAFGFRAATATISLGILAFLHQTQHWFVQQRGIWALIMVSISMNPTAGSSFFSFILRVIGTFLAMLLAWCVWYIPDQHTAGVIVFLWLAVSGLTYILLKRPTLLIWGMISMVTLTLIVGYELEIKKVGKAVATSNGQPYYPIYLFGPYRLATVLAGLAAGFFWLIFPYPISEHSQVRRGLGGTLYLLANYYSIVHELVSARIRGDDGDEADENCPGAMLEKARVKVFQKAMLSIAALRTYSNFVRFEVPIGGKFPKKEYDSIIQSTQSIFAFMTFASFASLSFKEGSRLGDSKWAEDFRRIIGGSGLTSQDITSLLSLMSSSIANGQPLPPFLKPPKAFTMSERMEAIDKDILSVRHVNEPCYAAFAVMQVTTRCIVVDLHHMLKNVKAICGELDFSFHIHSTSDPQSSSSTPSSSDVTLAARSRTRSRAKED